MPRGVRIEREYKGQALETYNQIQELTAKLKELKEQLKIDYKNQLVEEKLAAEEAERQQIEELTKMFKESGKSVEEIKSFLES